MSADPETIKSVFVKARHSEDCYSLCKGVFICENCKTLSGFCVIGSLKDLSNPRCNISKCQWSSRDLEVSELNQDLEDEVAFVEEKLLEDELRTSSTVPCPTHVEGIIS